MPGALLRVVLLGCLPFGALLPAAERWELQYFYDKEDSTLSFVDLQFPSARHGVALGVIAENRRRKPVVAITKDGGRAWELLPIKEHGLSLFFLSEQTGWLVAQKRHLFKSTDSGRTWIQSTLRDLRADPIRVFFLDESRGWLLCSQKQVYSTQDGGRSWQLLPVSRQPEVPEEHSFYTRAAFFQQQIGLLIGFSRVTERNSQLPDWMQPDLIPLGHSPTSSIILRSTDGGKSWSSSLVRNIGEIARVCISPSGVVLMLMHHPDSFTLPSEIIGFDLKTLRGNSAFASKDRYVTDIAFAGPTRAFAAAIDQEGRTPFPAIPGKLKILQSTQARQWTEMEVDYRAEARHALLAAPDERSVWVATDTGMILKLVSE